MVETAAGSAVEAGAGSPAEATGGPAGAASTGAGAALDDRYGRSRQKGVDRRIGWVLAAALLLVGLAVLLFGNWQQADAVDARTIGYTINPDRTVEVRFDVSVAPGTPLVCAVEALSPSFAEVGWKAVELEPSEQRTRRVAETLVTTSEATTGHVKSCWVPISAD